MRAIKDSNDSSKRTLWVVLAVLVAVIIPTPIALLYFGFASVDFWPAARQIDEAAKEYRQQGLPWVASDLYSPPVTPAENAAPLMTEALKKCEKLDMRKLGKLEEAKEWNALLDALKPYEGGLSAAASASKRTGVDFHRDWDMWVYVTFPEYLHVKDLVKALSYRAEARSALHDINGACQDLTTAWRFGALAAKEPTMISMLVTIACRAITLRSTRIVAAHVHDSPSDLALLRQTLGRMSGKVDFLYALRGEAFLGLSVCRNLDVYGGVSRFTKPPVEFTDEPPKPDPARIRRDGLPKGVMARAYTARHLETWAKAFAAMKAAGDDPEAQAKTMESIAQEAENKGMSYILEQIMLPVFTQAGVSVKRTYADRTVTEALVAALQEQAAGREPKTIQDVPGTWIDPFTEQPLKLRRTGDILRIYSVGANRVDDGGRTRSESQTSDDVVAAYPPIPPHPAKTKP